jgi:uncharacterized membrane protein YeiH
MFREFVEEFIVLAGLLLCMPFIIAILRSTGTFWFKSLALLDLIGLISFSVIHAQGLFKSGRKNRLIVFLILAVVTVLVSGIYFWVISEPLPA